MTLRPTLPPLARAARLRVVALLAGALALAACAGAPAVEETPPEVVAALARVQSLPIPPMKRPGPGAGGRVTGSNAALARDFLELSFLMESGRPLPVLSRFEGPVAVQVAGRVPPTAPRDLAELVGRLRREAGLDVRVASGPVPAGANRVTVEFLPRVEMQKLVPEAACFVVPTVGSWAEYRSHRRSPEVDWARLTRRTQATVFIPDDTAPQEIRDCLHEELAQALGPLNDLYRLPQSVFNDDNFQAVLTGYDMLMLRIFNAPELKTGMSRGEVAARLPAILARLNPGGGSGAQSAAPDPTPREWIDAVELALGPRGSDRARTAAAKKAVSIATGMGWTDGRAGFSWFALGRLSLSGDLETAFESFLRAALLFRASPGMEIQAAHVDMQLAAFALAAGQADDALVFADRAIPAARRGENPALLSTLMLVRAEALDLKGSAAAAWATRLDAMAWGLYGFGGADEVRQRVAEIAALSPRGQIRGAVLASAAGTR